MTDARSHEVDSGGAAPGRTAAVRTADADAERLRLRAMGSQDLSFVVEEHRQHFPDGFFARLGPRFLREYYRAFLTGSAARTAIAEVDGKPAGYLVGVTDPVAHRQHVVHRYGRTLVRRALTAMLVHPSLAWCFVRTRLGLYARRLVRRRRPAPAAASGDTGHATAVLTHVAVVPEAQSQGIGSALIGRFDAQVAAAGCDRLTLVTVSGEDGAGPYYERRGWEPQGERQTPDGRLLTTYERAVETPTDRQTSDRHAGERHTGDLQSPPPRSDDTA